MKKKNDSQGEKMFENILLAIIYNPETKKILIGRRENDPHIKELSWCFPGGRPCAEEDIDECLKKKVKLKTGYEISSLGAVFAKTYPEKRNLFAVYYLCEVTGGKEEFGDDLVELKWVAPEELEKFFTTSFHPILKEYIINLK
jgi:ADP-ribose pyrophosphatase YjhB (NUDIX family)